MSITHYLPLALALAGAAGLRAFLPLFHLCLAATLGLVDPHQLNPHFVAWLDRVGPDTVLWALGALAAIEILAEAIPAVASRTDLAALALRIPSALLCAFAVMPLRDLDEATSLAFFIGFGGALLVLNLQVRNVADGGPALAAYVHAGASLLLSGVCLAVVSVAPLKPYAGLLLLYGGTWGLTLLAYSWSRSVKQTAQTAALRPAPELPDDFVRRTACTPQP